MRKLAIVLIAAATLVGCGDNDDDDDLGGGIDDGDGDGTGDDGIPPATLEWTAQLAGLDIYSVLAGTATVRQVTGAQSFTATATLRNDSPGAVRPWHVHFGTCGSGGAIVGGDTTYPRLMIGADGSAEATTPVPVALDPSMQYHVNVHLSDAQLGTLIACGDLIRS